LTAAVPADEAPPLSPRPAAAVYLLRDPKRLDDAGLLQALRASNRAAQVAFFERFGKHVELVLVRVLGADADVSDAVNETFLRALDRLDQVHDPAGFKPWLASIAVFVAREHLRNRRRRGWLRLWGYDDPPEVAGRCDAHDAAEAARRLYALLDRMPDDERIAFVFRFVEQMELTEVASVCGASLATIKRTLARAETRFAAWARRDPVLREWVEGSARWIDR
jgi:RNA polymerase sigma-70 factor (ECF subfamily)